MFPVLGAFLIMNLYELEIYILDTFLKFFFQGEFHITWGFAGDSDGKESACCVGDLGLIPGSGRSPGEGNSYPLQYSGLENSGLYSPWGYKQSDTTERNQD